MSVHYLHNTPEASARIELVRAMAELGAITTQLPRAVRLLNGAMAQINALSFPVKGTGELNRIVLTLQQIEVGVSRLYDAAGEMGQLVAGCKAMPDDGTDAVLREMGLGKPEENK